MKILIMLRKVNIFIFLFLLLNIASPKETIIFAFQVHRHGARAPYDGVKDGIDIYKENWTQIAELSEIGKRQLYLLGVKARKRYINQYNLLSEKYNPQEIYIKSTDSNRTIESIYSFLQGLYPPGSGPLLNNKIIENKNITYPPNLKYKNYFDDIIKEFNMSLGQALPYQMSIEPIHLFYKPDHDSELYDSTYCYGFKEEYELLQRREEIFNFVDNIMNETNNMFMDLEETKNKTFLYDYWTLYKYMDGFLCDDTDLRKFEFMKKTYGDDIITKLRNYSKTFIDMDYFGTNFPESRREIGIVANSYTLHSLLNWMEIAKNGFEKKINKYIKYVIFSAHDSTIGALESFVRLVFNKEMDSCTFGDSRYFELYFDDDDNKYKVRYLKGDGTIKLTVDYNEFKDIINNRTWSDEKVGEFCQFEDNIIKSKNNKKEEVDKNVFGKTLMICLIVFNVILIAILIIINYRKK